MATTTADVPEDDEAWLYGDPVNREAPGGDAAGSSLSADAPPFEPSAGAAAETEDGNDDKEAGEVSGEDHGDDDDSDDDDVQVTIGDIKTQPQTYEKFKSGYTRSGQAKTGPVKGVDLEAPGMVGDQSIYEYDITRLNDDERPWRKPGADITDYFNYGFTEDTWLKYCEKQKYLRNENGVGGKMFIHTLPSASRRDRDRDVHRERDPAPPPKPQVDPVTPSPSSYRPTSTPTSVTTPTTTPTQPGSTDRPALPPHLAGPPPGRKMSGTIDVIGSTRNDSRRPKNQYDYENQQQNNPNDYGQKKWPPTDLPPPHIPPPGYGAPPPPIPIPPPQPVPPPQIQGPPPMGYYPPPSGPPPGYDNRGPYGYEPYHAPPPGYGVPPPQQPVWDNRANTSYGSGEWDYRRDRSPSRTESDYSRDLNYERSRHERSRDRMDRSMERDDRSRDRERRHRSDRERSDKEKEDRHKKRKEGSEGSEHKSSKHKKSKRSKRDREDESMETSGAEPGSPPS